MNNESSPKPLNWHYQGHLEQYSFSIRSDLTTMTICIFKDGELPRKKYQASFQFENLLQKSKWFCLFDTIGNISDEIVILFKEAKVKIEEEMEKVYLYLIIGSRQVEDIHLEIPVIEEFKSNILEDICYLINQMNKTLDSQIRQFEFLEKSPQFQKMIEQGKMNQKKK